jgi:hypothetical protein
MIQMPEITPVWLAVCQLVITLFVLGGTGIWRLAKTEQDITEKIAKLLHDIKEETGKELDTIREKQAHTEKWILEAFVRREDVYTMMGQLRETLNSLGERLDLRMSRIEDKLDRKN